MKSITSKKDFEEIKETIKGIEKVFLVGCGTCATMCHTGGVQEVIEMKEELEKSGKKVTGWLVPPVTCDELTKDALQENMEAIKESDALLVLSCAFGVHSLVIFSEKPVYPATNTLFIGKEDSPGQFSKVCIQCGECILALTGGICPIARCAKQLLNGPCGGAQEGKCEISPDMPCAWQLIIDRLSSIGCLHKLEDIAPVKDWGRNITSRMKT